MPAIAPGESPELDSLTISVVGADSVESVPMMVVVLVVSDGLTVVVSDVSDGAVDISLAVVSGAMLVDESSCPPHRKTVVRRQKACRTRLSFIVL